MQLTSYSKDNQVHDLVTVTVVTTVHVHDLLASMSMSNCIISLQIVLLYAPARPRTAPHQRSVMPPLH